MAMAFYAAALLLTNDLDTLRELMLNSLIGAAIEDDKLQSSLATVHLGPFGWEKTEDGFRSWDLESFLLLARGLRALPEEDTDASRTALRAWLPPAAELLRIAEYEQAWLSVAGGNHPALLCARLHGERLGDWSVVVEVAQGLLRFEHFNPMLRTEAHRLLGRALAELGQRAAACEAAERAVAEAAGAKYAWLEMLSLRDLLRWGEAGEAESVHSRLRGVVGRLVASADELKGVLGEDVSRHV